jgi:hypothetical protein
MDLAANDAAFTFNPSVLKAGTYRISVQVSDSGTPTLSAQTQMDLLVEEPPSTPTQAGALEGLELVILGGLVYWQRRRRS